MAEINDILTILKDLDNSTSFNVFIPSLKKEIPFKQLSTEQLKDLLKTVVDSPIYNSQFITTFNKIITNNCLDLSINVKNLSIYDKLFIIFKTKIESISPDFKFTFTEDEIKNNSLENDSFSFDVKTHFDNFIKKEYSFNPEIIEINNISLTCDLPTLDTENKIEKELHKNIKIEIKTEEELREIVGETFINELTKYITKINLGETTMNLLELDFKNRIKIVEQLPTPIINKVLKYIENYRNKIKELTSVKIKGIEKDFPLDASFFNI